MVDPVRVQGQRAIRLALSDDQVTHRDDIRAMFTVAREQFGPRASLANFEFRVKESGGERYLELREQSWFGRLKEKWDFRLHDRLVERHQALDALQETFGDGLLRRLNIATGLTPNYVQARGVVQYLKEETARPPLLDRFQAAGFATYESAANFVDSKINFVKTTTKADLVEYNKLQASALEHAVFADPTILDDAKTREERAAIFDQHEEVYFQRQIAEFKNIPKSDESTPEEHATYIDEQVQNQHLVRSNLRNADLDILDSPKSREVLKRTLIKGKDAGLRLIDLATLGRGETYESTRKLDDYVLKDQLSRVYQAEIMTDDEMKSLTRFFRLPNQ